MPAEKAKNLDVFVSVLGEALTIMSKRHEKEKHAWPNPEYVEKLKDETRKGMIPLIIEKGTDLGPSGKFTKMGEHDVLRRGETQVGEYIKLPSNIFNPDGTINEDKGAVLVHEYCHALQNVAMRDMPEADRARIPVSSVEYANQALAMKAWDEMQRVRNATEKDGAYWAAKQKIIREYGGDVFKAVPSINRSTMRYQDRMSRYPGEFFIEEHPDFFKEEEGRLDVEVREKYFKNLEGRVLRQFKAAEDGVDVNDRLDSLIGKKIGEGGFKGFDDYMLDWHAEATKELKDYTPVTLKDAPEARAILDFYKREAKHLREITKLEKMRGKLERGQLPARELAVLHDFASRNIIAEDVKRMDHGRLIDYAVTHKLGEIEGNRMRMEARGILGRELKTLHDAGYSPGEKLAEIYERQKWWDSPDKERAINGIRSKAREKEMKRPMDAVSKMKERKPRPI